MVKANRFEELIVWQRSRELARSIYELAKKDPFSRDHKLVSQIRDAARSVMANIAEGFERRSRHEFHQAVVTAKGSAGEVRSDLYIALDQDYISESEFKRALNLCVEVSRLLEALRSELDAQRQMK